MQEPTDYYLSKQIGNYRLVKKLGGGAFGSVYQAQHIIFGDDVAIKILHANLRSQQEREGFFHEARILKTLQHPNILHILDAGLYEGVCYIVMDYASGGSLNDHLKQHPGQALPQNEALAIIEQVGAALHEAHQHNIVHRDLKPDNILFDAKGNSLLADFGIAALLEKTSSVDVIGTPPYMAPEQFQGKVSPRSDQYSLGIIAYTLLTGQRPFNAPSGDMFAWGWQHYSQAPTPPTHHNPRIPAPIEQAILKALAKDREQRYSTVALFVEALRTSVKTKEEWLEEGNKHWEVKRYEEALLSYDQALGLDPNYADAYYGKGNVLYDLNRYEEAFQAYDYAIRLDPNYAHASHKRGRVLLNLKQFDEASQAYDHALRLDPNYAYAYYILGLLFRELDRDKEAQQMFEKARQLGFEG